MPVMEEQLCKKVIFDNLTLKFLDLRAVHVKIVSPLFSSLIFKIFPRLYEIYFDGLLSGKILQKNNIQNEWHKLEEKWLNSVVFEHITVWYFHFMFGRNSAEIQRQQKTFYYLVFTNIKAKEHCNCLKVQSYKLYNNKYMITSIQITNTEIFIFIAVLVFKLLNHKSFVYKQTRQ